MATVLEKEKYWIRSGTMPDGADEVNVELRTSNPARAVRYQR